MAALDGDESCVLLLGHMHTYKKHDKKGQSPSISTRQSQTKKLSSNTLAGAEHVGTTTPIPRHMDGQIKRCS
jgi:hypothetical protein